MSRSEGGFDPAAFLAHTARDLAGIEDVALRTVRFIERMAARTTEEGAEALALLWGEGGTPPRGVDPLVPCLLRISLFREQLGEEWCREVHHTLVERGKRQTANLLISPPPLKSDPPQADPELERITLGMRKTMAKISRKGMLEKILLDPTPAVVEHLLTNPRLTEREVLKIASRRPCPAETLERIHASRRWIGCYAVKKALIRNPYTPPGIAVGLLRFLMVQDLREVAGDEALHPDVQEAASKLLSGKGAARRGEERWSIEEKE